MRVTIINEKHLIKGMWVEKRLLKMFLAEYEIFNFVDVCNVQRRRAIEALEARAPPPVLRLWSWLAFTF